MSTATAQQFRLPDVGEGLTEAEILSWEVKNGDVVEINQTLVQIETAKSVVELPSPFAGRVLELLVSEGEVVPVGTPIISIGEAAGDAPQDPAENPTSPARNGEGVTPVDQPKLLVGYGAREESGPTRRRRGSAAPAEVGTGSAAEPPTSQSEVKPRAKPPVRLLAKTLGVDLSTVTPSGPGSIVVRDDVIKAANAIKESGAQGAAVSPAGLSPAEQATVPETRIPIKGVRKQTAAAMVASAFTAPHVTEFVTVDVTKTMELRDAVQRRAEFRELKLTPLAFIARAYLIALQKTPMGNARWDEESQEIVLPSEINLGIAAATPRGLMVPNIRSAQRLGLADLSKAIGELAATARAGKSSPESMARGTTTITNVGVFGVDTGTPILNPGETAILAVGAIRRQPWVVGAGAEEHIEPRSILQLALSFDHRVIDGQEGSRLLADTAAILAEPGLALL